MTDSLGLEAIRLLLGRSLMKLAWLGWLVAMVSVVGGTACSSSSTTQGGGGTSADAGAAGDSSVGGLAGSGGSGNAGAIGTGGAAAGTAGASVGGSAGSMSGGTGGMTPVGMGGTASAGTGGAASGGTAGSGGTVSTPAPTWTYIYDTYLKGKSVTDSPCHCNECHTWATDKDAIYTYLVSKGQMDPQNPPTSVFDVQRKSVLFYFGGAMPSLTSEPNYSAVLMALEATKAQAQQDITAWVQAGALDN